MAKAGYTVHVLSDYIVSYDERKIPEMPDYCGNKGCVISTLEELL